MKLHKIFFVFLVLWVVSYAFSNCYAVNNSAAPNYFLKTTSNRPYGIAFDKKGTMYMVTAPTTGNGTLSKVTPDGNVTDIAVLEGNFIGPGIYIDNSNGIFITVGDKLLKVTPDGNTKIIADGFSRCFDVKEDKEGNIYVADDFKSTIYKITPAGKKDVFYKSDATGRFVLTGIIIDSSNENLYAREGNRIIKLKIKSNDTSEKPEVILDNTKLFYLCTDDNNTIYASTLDNVIKIDADGKAHYLSQNPLKTSIGFAVGGKGFDKGSLYVTVEDGIVKLPISK
jgi:DNA-binding beta-propeller fold protein YncE